VHGVPKALGLDESATRRERWGGCLMRHSSKRSAEICDQLAGDDAMLYLRATAALDRSTRPI
jgi:hypothetical protein